MVKYFDGPNVTVALLYDGSVKVYTFISSQMLNQSLPRMKKIKTVEKNMI